MAKDKLAKKFSLEFNYNTMKTFKKIKHLRSCLAAALCCLTFIAASAQSQYSETVLDGPFIENDTIFLRKVKVYYDGKYSHTNKLYIEPRHDKDTYLKNLFAIIYPSDSTQIKEGIERLNKKYKLPKYSKTGMPNGTFFPLHKYNGKYYLYSPQQCPWVGLKILSGQYLIMQDFDGFYPTGITELTQTSPTSWHVSADASHSEYYDDYTPYANLDIYLIDADRGIYLWHNHDKSPRYEYELVVDIEHATEFDMIVWHTIELTDEFDEFEKIDYRKILRLRQLVP